MRNERLPPVILDYLKDPESMSIYLPSYMNLTVIEACGSLQSNLLINGLFHLGNNRTNIKIK